MPSGIRPRPSEARPRPSGARPRPSGARPRPSGARPRPFGARPRPSGARPRPSEVRPRPSGARYEPQRPDLDLGGQIWTSEAPAGGGDGRTDVRTYGRTYGGENSPVCECIGHQPLRGRCPKGKGERGGKREPVVHRQYMVSGNLALLFFF